MAKRHQHEHDFSSADASRMRMCISRTSIMAIAMDERWPPSHRPLALCAAPMENDRAMRHRAKQPLHASTASPAALIPLNGYCHSKTGDD